MYFQTKDTARIRIVTRLAKKNTVLYNFFFFFLGEAVLYSLIDKRSPSPQKKKKKKNDKRWLKNLIDKSLKVKF